MPAAKCRQCQINLLTNNAYKVIINKKNAYFCNEEHYALFLKNIEDEARRKEEEKQRKQAAAEAKRIAAEKRKAEDAGNRDRAYRLICEIIGRPKIINTILWKEWKIWNKVATNEVIAQYLEENRAYLASVVSRLEDVEFKRIRYLSAILKNKLGDFKPKAKEEEKPVVPTQEETEVRADFGLHVNNKKKIARRKGFAEMEG